MSFGYTPFAPRPVESHGVRTYAGHRLKVYSVRYGEEPFELSDYDEGVDLALTTLPTPDPGAGRPGLGFVIVHRGRGVDYVVLAWWDRENELTVRVFVRDDGRWRPARDGESFCVWDLEIIALERDSYVKTILAGDDAAGPEAYIGARFDSRLDRSGLEPGSAS